MGNSMGMRSKRRASSERTGVGRNQNLSLPIVQEISRTSLHDPETSTIGVPAQSDLSENETIAKLEEPTVSLPKRRKVLMAGIFPFHKTAIVSKNTIQFWISPFEKLPFSEPFLKSNGEYGLDEPGISHFPRFLEELVNNTFRLHMRLEYTNAKPEFLECHPEVVYLIRNLKFIRVKLMSHPLDDRVKVDVEESHTRKRVNSLPRFRPMYTKFMLLDHIGPSITISGGEFLLNLTLPRDEVGVTWSDFNSDQPVAVGHYMRELDTNPNLVLEWSVAVWKKHDNSIQEHYTVNIEEEKEEGEKRQE